MKYVITLFILFVTILTARSQEPNPNSINSSFAGKHFFLSFMQNENYINYEEGGQVLVFHISPTADAEITVILPGISTNKYKIAADSVLPIFIPDNFHSDFEIRTSEEVKNKMVEIISDVPVIVYAFNSQYTTTEGYTAIPVENWGTEYVVMAFPNDQYVLPDVSIPVEDSVRRLDPRSNEFLIMAAYDSTIASFRPRAITNNGKQTTTTYTIVLNKGQCYLVKSLKSQRGTSDMTGTIVTANKPFGLLSGHVRTAVVQNLDINWESKNHLIEMLSPTSSWGRHFITIPFIQNYEHGDFFRVTCIKPNTSITYQTASSSETKFMVNPGDYVSFVGIHEPAEWMADNPVQIAQFFAHSGRNGDMEDFDPAMVMIPPVEQYVNSLQFSISNDVFMGSLIGIDGPPNHFVNLVYSENSLKDIKFDGVSVSSLPFTTFGAVPGTELSWARIRLTEGKHKIETQQGRFSGIVYGTIYKDAYAIALGSSLVDPKTKDIIPPKIAYTDDCGIINGTITEQKDSSGYAIDYIRIINDKTNNYSFVADTITDTTSIVKFHAEPVDPMKDAKIEFIVYDKNGNSSRFSFEYKGITVATTDEIAFYDVDWKESTCYSFLINNLGSDTILVDSTYFSSNPKNKLKYTLDKTLPVLLPPRTAITVTVCFTPGGDTTSIFSEFVIEFSCNRKIKIPINGTVRALDLYTRDYDFGDVRVGDTACATISVVNMSNKPLHLTGIDFYVYWPQFQIDTAGIFPVELAPGDSLILKVCFSPQRLQNYTIVIHYQNDEQLANEVYVKGRGVAPNIPSIVIDWKERRVGTTNDTIMHVINMGTGGGRIKFDRLEVITDASAFDLEKLTNLESAIAAGDTLFLVNSFKPEDRVLYHVKAYYNVDWKPHNQVVIELIGQGTMPDIETFDIDMGIVEVFDRKDSIAKILKAGGNEPITIDDIKFSSGDQEDFVIDYNLLKNLYIAPDSILKTAIRFAPLSLGNKSIVMEVTHDALPDYMRAKSYINIFGLAVDDKIPDAAISIIAPNQIIACKIQEFEVILENTGTADLDLQSLELDPVNLNAKWVDDPVLPIKFTPGEVLKFKIIAQPYKAEECRINVIAKMNNESVVETLNYSFVPTVVKLDLDAVYDLESKPGDSVAVVISGSTPYPVDMLTDNLRLWLHIRQRSYFLTTNTGILEITPEGDATKYITVQLIQNSENVVIEIPPQIIEENKKITWKLKIPFLSLLSHENFSDIRIIAASDLCFDADTVLAKANIAEVCVNNIRIVKLIDEDISLSVMPNPVSNELNVNLFIPEDDMISIDLIDNIGKKYNLCENLFLKKGRHSLIFETDTFVSGTYLISAQNKKATKNLLIIISK